MFNELDLKQLWKELDDYNKELDKETKVLQEVWMKIAQLKSKNDESMNKIMENQELQFLPPDTVIGLNIGGQIFETTVSVLTVDPYSLLAACCRTTPPFKATVDGFYFFDRDWWLFRHIIAFLRSNKLPQDLETLKELYREASFYRLQRLQIAIENIPVANIALLSTKDEK
eukprot:gene2836-3020_t